MAQALSRAEPVEVTDHPRRPPEDRQPSTRRADVLALAGVFALGVAVRVAVLRSPLGALNSDEATVGLMAERILRGEVPLVVAGNNYGGTLEPFLLAPVLALTGASALALKVLPTIIWLLASGALYLVTAPLLGRRPALVLAGTLWIFSFSMVVLSTMSNPGYSSGVVACLVALLLLLRELSPQPPARTARRVLAGRLLLGFVTGLAVWFHPMHIAFLLPAHAFVLMGKRRSDLGGWVAPNAVGALVGALPMLVHMLRGGLTALDHAAQPPSTYPVRLLDFARELLPRLTSLQSFYDATWVGGGLGVALFLAALLGFAVAVLRLRRGSPAEQMVSWIAIGFPFLIAVFPTSWYYGDARYGVAYAPVILLVLGLTWARELPERRLSAQALFALPFLWFALFCYPLSAQLTGSPVVGGPDADIPPLAAALDSWDVREVHADYWIAYRLSFLSDTDLTATPFNDIRFADDDRRVQEAGAAVGYVVPIGDWRDGVFASTLTGHERRPVGLFAVYVPLPDA